MFFRKPKLDETISAHILTAFAQWINDEFDTYTGDMDTCMLKNIITTHPSVFNDIDLGTSTVEHYFVMSNTADQRVATRLCIFVSKLNLIFGSDIVTQFKERCIRSMIVDYHFNVKNLESYLKLSDLFWTYPVLLVMGTLELRDLAIRSDKS